MKIRWLVAKFASIYCQKITSRKNCLTRIKPQPPNFHFFPRISHFSAVKWRDSFKTFSSAHKNKSRACHKHPFSCQMNKVMFYSPELTSSVIKIKALSVCHPPGDEMENFSPFLNMKLVRFSFITRNISKKTVRVRYVMFIPIISNFYT